LRVLGIIAKWLFILSFPVLLLTASIGIAVNSQLLYEYGFEKYNISQSTGLAEEELEKAAGGLIDYFNSGEEHINLTVIKNGEPFELFNEREKLHLKDVKDLIWLDSWVLLGTLIYALAYAGVSLFWQRKRHWRRLAWGVVGGSGITLAMMLAMGIASLTVDFGQAFTQFHLIAFTNELWQLDPTKDYLIMLFPQGFWYDVVIFCGAGVAGTAAVLGGVCGRYLFSTRRNKDKMNYR